MANTNYGINVNVNFSGVSYNPNTQTWTGVPTWNVNPTAQAVPPVKAGTDTNTITWSLHAAALPSGFTAAFAATPITFAPTPAWTGSTPANSNSTTCVANDNFNGLAVNEVYEYMVSVMLSNGTVSYGFSYDPDVENEAGTVNVAALVRTRK